MEWEAGKAIQPKPSGSAGSLAGSATGSSGSVTKPTATPASSSGGGGGKVAGWSNESDDDWGEEDDWAPGPSVPTPPLPSTRGRSVGRSAIAGGARRFTGFGGGGPTRSQRAKSLVKMCVGGCCFLFLAMYVLNVGSLFKRAESDAVVMDVTSVAGTDFVGRDRAPRVGKLSRDAEDVDEPNELDHPDEEAEEGTPASWWGRFENPVLRSFPSFRCRAL